MILTFCIVIEYVIIFILNKMHLTVQTWMGNAIGAFIFLLPIQIMLFMLGRDEHFSNKKRTCFKVIFWFIIVCYLLGGIASIFNYI